MDTEQEYVACKSQINPDRTVSFQAIVKSPSQYASMTVMAANPINRMTNYSGSGLPFPCSQIAFENSPNVATIPISGEIATTFVYPNSYYTSDMRTRICPSIFFLLKHSDGQQPIVVQHKLDEELPLRTLVHRPGHAKGPQFYSAKEELIGIRSAEATMRTLKEYKSQYDIA
jgi:hypothetical protein